MDQKRIDSSLSRRELLVAGVGWAAWGATPRGAGAADEPPRYGGILTQDTFADAPHFDLHQSETIAALLPLAPCYNRLVQYDPFDSTRIVPDLAERWEISQDGRLYTFHLRRGVKFHHGKPFKAEDVRASWDRIIDPPKGVFSVRKLIFDAVSGIETPDDHTVRFVLKRPMASLLANIGQGWNVIFPKDVLDAKGDMKRDVVGTGPFKLKQYVRGVSLEVEKYPDYHVKGRPYLDGVKTFVIPDLNTAVNAYIAGQLLLHEATTESQAEQARLRVGSRGVIARLTQMSALTMEMNATRKPWSDPRVRQAASMAIDRKEAVDVMTDGAGEPSGMMLSTGPWALPAAELQKLPGYALDKAAERARARKLLAEAGFPNGFKATMIVRRGQQFESAAVLLKDQLGQVGIDVNLEIHETAAFYDKTRKRDFELYGGSYSTAVDDPDAIFGQNYLCNAGRNYSAMCVPEVEKLFLEQSQIRDPKARLPVVHQLQRVALQNVMKAVLGFRVTFYLYAGVVRNYRPHYSRYLSESREQVWLARG
ncbi:MAG: ABC transporter substrate-binding protein [Candidatus Rokubacteria bacterium]|nr:ABC transporter substrate-binding protein [Candidatus Rokubacteria bacterium]